MLQLTRLTRVLAAFALVVLMTNHSADALDQTEGRRGDTSNLATLTQAGPTPIEPCHLQRRALARHACAARMKQFEDANEMRIESQR
jgi:hypothetical protein